MSMRLYPPELLDALQARSGWSDEIVSDWLQGLENTYERDMPAHEWHDDPQSCTDYVYLCVMSDIMTKVQVDVKTE